MALTEPSVVDEEGWSGANEGSPSATARPKLPRSNRAVVFWVASGLAAVGCILATASLASAALPRLGRHTAKTKDAISLAAGTLEVVLPEDPDKECKLIEGWAPWVSVFKCPEVIVPCSMEGDDCTRSECCKEPGKQCYKKTDYYASCRADCEAGVHEEDDDGEPWSCETRGEKAEGTPDDVTGETTSAGKSSAVGATAAGAAASTAAATSGPCGEEEFSECTDSKCCVDLTMKCYAKNDFFAMCKATCTAGEIDEDDDLKEPWQCTVVDSGGSTAATGASATGDATGDCADPGEDCSKVGCCTEVGHTCYKKNDGWASCKPECTAGQPDPDDVDATPWDCTEVPARRL